MSSPSAPLLPFPVGPAPGVSSPAAPTNFAITPPDASQLDLHVTNFNSVQMWNDGLQEFDGHMAIAETSETAAYTAAADLAGQSADLATSSDAAAAATDASSSDVFAQGAADVDANQAASASTISQAGDALTSANQPLTTLQGEDTPAPPPAPESLQDYIDQYPNWSQIPPVGQQQIIVQWCQANPNMDGCAPYV